MTKKNFGRSLVAGICGCLAFAGIALAAVTATRTWTTSSSQDDEVYSYEQLAEVEEKLGYDFHVPESIAEGYTDPELAIVDEAVAGEDGEALYSYKNASVTYTKDGAGWICVNATRREDLDQESPGNATEQDYDERKEIDGITVDVTTQNYKIVPVDYEITPEDQAAMDKGDLNISYGAEEVSEMSISNASLDIDGIAYLIIDSNGSDAESMVAMAEKVIRAE